LCTPRSRATWAIGRFDSNTSRTARHATPLITSSGLPSTEHLLPQDSAWFGSLEHETLNWIGFYNAERLHEELGDLPPTEYEEVNYKKDNITSLSTK
jgi:transposase InsO family protein